MFKLVEELTPVFRATQEEILQTIGPDALTAAGYSEVAVTEYYLYGAGIAPVLLVAHADTVHSQPPCAIYCDDRAGVVWSPQGLGADDRAGVTAIMRIVADLPARFRPHVLITADEEVGVIGAMVAAGQLDIGNTLHFIVELDRRNCNDSVFYDCANRQFIDYIGSFGYIPAQGTLSDISILCPAWQVAGVNLSIGYRCEHTLHEHLCLTDWLVGCERVTRICKSLPARRFDYVSHTAASLHDPYGNYPANVACGFEPSGNMLGEVLFHVGGLVVTLADLRLMYGLEDNERDWLAWYLSHEADIALIERYGSIDDLFGLIEGTMFLRDGCI